MRAPRFVGTVLSLQQFWFWGQDVRLDDNLLLKRGFKKSGQTQKWPTRYTLQEDGRTIRLWSFGLQYGTPEGSVVLHRQDFAPRVDRRRQTPPESVQWPWHLESYMADLPALDPRQHGLVAEALEWIAEYEDWIARVAGRDHRVRCLRAWHSARVVPAHRMADAWRRMAADIRARCAEQEPLVIQ